MTTFLVWCTLIMPWVFIPIKNFPEQFRVPQGVFLDFMFMGIISIFLSQGAKYTYRNKYLSMFIGYLLFSVFLYFDILFMLAKPVPIYMFVPIMHLFLGIFATYILLVTLEKNDYIRISKSFCVSASLISVFALLQFIGCDPLKSVFSGLWVNNAQYKCANIVSACLDNPNLVGSYLALTSPLFLYFSQKRYKFGYLLSFIATLCTQSHIAIALFILGLLIYLIIKYRKYKVYIISGITILVLALSVIFSSKIPQIIKLDNNFSHRLDGWKDSIPHLKDNPLFGLGLGAYKSLEIITNGDYGTASWIQAHNDYLQYAIEIGLIGLFLLLLLLANTFRNYKFEESIGNAYFTSLILFLLLMVVSFPLEVPTIAFIGLFSWCAVEKL